MNAADWQRLYRLTPQRVRDVVAPGLIGNYTLFSEQPCVAPTYIGRSDTCLRRRLVGHARRGNASFFTFSVQLTPVQAFVVECAAYHARDVTVTNRSHPASPNFSRQVCPFCWHSFEQGRSRRSRSGATVLDSQ